MDTHKCTPYCGRVVYISLWTLVLPVLVNSGIMDIHFREFFTLCQNVQYSTIGIGGF